MNVITISETLETTQPFTGTVSLLENALTQRTAIIAAASGIKVASDTDLEMAVKALQEINGMLKVNESSRVKEKKPHLDYGKAVDKFAADFAEPLEKEKTRLTGEVNHFQRKQLEDQQKREREAAQTKRDADAVIAKAAEDARKAQEAIDQMPITTANGLLYRDGKVIELPEADKVAIKNGYKHAEEMVRALEAKQNELADKLIDAQLAQEEAGMSQQAAGTALAAPTNIPRGLTVRVRYDFEITNCIALVAKKPDLWTWYPGTESLKFDRAGFLKALNNEAVPHPLLPEEAQQSVVHSSLGLRVYRDVSSHVRA